MISQSGSTEEEGSGLGGRGRVVITLQPDFLFDLVHIIEKVLRFLIRGMGY